MHEGLAPSRCTRLDLRSRLGRGIRLLTIDSVLMLPDALQRRA